MNLWLLTEYTMLAVNISSVVKGCAAVGITGLLIGILLGIAGKIFAVSEDEKAVKIREFLPGNNCGGCGFAGCDALSKAISEGTAAFDACPVADSKSHSEIAKILGTSGEAKERLVAFVKCSGTCDKTDNKYTYFGTADCKSAMVVPGSGGKSCSYGCIGFGSCVNACAFDAIHVINGAAVVDEEKCKACKKCIEACPKQLIELIPVSAKHKVKCSSKDKGKDVKSVCSTGCIGCGICVKQCEYGAITLNDNLAYIDASKCTGCGKCAEKCPQKIII